MANPTAEEAILTKLAQAPSFHPAGAKLFVPDWTLDPGDMVTVTAKDNVNDPDETPTYYNVPIYSLNLTWNGASRVEIESTGNQQREPLSALRRKEYQAGRRGYGQFKEIDDEFKEFETWQTQTDEVIGTYAAQFVDILGDETNEGRLTLAETAIEQTASDATITAQAAGILLDEDGHPILDERGKYQYDPNAADTTLIAQINTNATEILAKVSQSDLTTTLSSYLQINAFSTELASTLDNGDTTLAAKIITAVNKNTNTSSVVISADQINLDGVVSAVFLDSRMANIDKLFTEEGTALEITAGTANIMNLNWLSGDSDSDSVGLKTIRVNGVAPTNIGFLGTGSDTILDINTVGIVSASVSNNVLTLTDTAGNHVNFSKATSVSGEWGSNQQGQPTGVFTVTATQTNRNTTTGLDEPTTVGTVLTSITQAGHWGNTNNQEDPNTYYQSTNATIDTRQTLYAVKTAEINAAGRFYAGKNSVGLAPMSYTAFQGENYPASQTIYTDTTGRTDTSGATDNLHRDITLSLDVDDDYVYMKHGSDIIARISNTGSGSGDVYDAGYAAGQNNASAEVKSVALNRNRTSYSSANHALSLNIIATSKLVLLSHDDPPIPSERNGNRIEVDDTMNVAVTSATLSAGEFTNGQYTITGSGGKVNIDAVDGEGGANIPVGVNPLTFTPTAAIADGREQGWGAAYSQVSWPTSGTSNSYIDVSAPISTVDGPADVRRFIIRNDDQNNDIAYISTLNSQNNTYTNYAMLNHGKYTAGQNSVTAILTLATPPSGTSPSPLINGTYGVFLSKGGVLDSTAVSYHRVTSGGSVTYVVSSNGEPIMVWNGLSVVGSLYPNTDVVASSTTDQLGRRQISYNSGTISRTGYVSNSSLSSTKGSTNYPGRIGWTDEGGGGASRSVTGLSNVILASTDTTTSTHTVDVTYDDGNTVTGGATVTVDASAISGGGANIQHNRTITYSANDTYILKPTGNFTAMSQVAVTVAVPSGITTQRTASGLVDTIVLPATHTGTATITGNIVLYDDDSESSNFPVKIDASAVYAAGQQSGGGSNRTVSSLSSISLSRSDTGTSTKNTTVTYTSGSNSTASISVNASNVYQQGVDDGYTITATEISAGSFQVQTGSTSGRTSAGSISGQSVYNARNSGYIFFTATCRGKTRNFYVAINA